MTKENDVEYEIKKFTDKVGMDRKVGDISREEIQELVNNIVKKHKKDNKIIELKDATIQKTKDGKLQTVVLKNNTCCFFIESKDVNLFISFRKGLIKLTSFLDEDESETEIKEISFHSVTKKTTKKFNIVEKENKIKHNEG